MRWRIELTRTRKPTQTSGSRALSLDIWNPWLWSTPKDIQCDGYYYCKLMPESVGIMLLIVLWFLGLMSPFNFKAIFSFKMRTLANKTIKQRVIYGPVNNAKSSRFFYYRKKCKNKCDKFECVYVTQDFLSNTMQEIWKLLLSLKKWNFSLRWRYKTFGLTQKEV